MFTALILLSVIVILLLTSLLIGPKTGKHPPGPFSWPFIGNQSLLKRMTDKLGAQHLALSELARRYGSNLITLHLGINKVVVVSGNKPVMAVLMSDEYDGRPWNEFIKMRNLGQKNGITMNEGSEWKEVRSWTMQALKSFGFGKVGMLNMIKDELNEVLDSLKDGGVKMLKPLITPAVINVLWTIAAGKRFNETSKLEYFVDLLDRRARVFDMFGGILSTFPWIRYIAPEASGYNLLQTLNVELRDFLMKTINEHKQKYVIGSEADLIDMFITEMNKDKYNTIYNDDQLVMILIDLFIAGVTTTATTLDFLFMNMVVHQDVQQKLQKEIDSVVPASRLPDLGDKMKLPYAEAVITESQRLWPVLPVIGPRRVLRDTYLDNYSLPKDSTILLNLYSIHTDPDIFPEPLKFQPERFIKNGVFDHNAEVLTFGKGRRRCPGNILAKSALFLLFVGVMKKYSLLPVPSKGPWTVETIPGLIMSPKPYDVLIVPR
ncbi:putative cytochrome P450 305a1 [Colletes latitarsis]|uniref:putative cytochrome P450 305a1 n=1 Tax=Colletes latitarsis TaxID=2605962 RepID=UPI00403604B0